MKCRQEFKAPENTSENVGEKCLTSYLLSLVLEILYLYEVNYAYDMLATKADLKLYRIERIKKFI